MDCDLASLVLRLMRLMLHLLHMPLLLHLMLLHLRLLHLLLLLLHLLLLHHLLLHHLLLLQLLLLQLLLLQLLLLHMHLLHLHRHGLSKFNHRSLVVSCFLSLQVALHVRVFSTCMEWHPSYVPLSFREKPHNLPLHLSQAHTYIYLLVPPHLATNQPGFSLPQQRSRAAGEMAKCLAGLGPLWKFVGRRLAGASLRRSVGVDP